MSYIAFVSCYSLVLLTQSKRYERQPIMKRNIALFIFIFLVHSFHILNYAFNK